MPRRVSIHVPPTSARRRARNRVTLCHSPGLRAARKGASVRHGSRMGVSAVAARAWVDDLFFQRRPPAVLWPDGRLGAYGLPLLCWA